MDVIKNNAVLGNGRLQVPTKLPTVAGRYRRLYVPNIVEEFSLAGLTISMTAANDFGGIKLADLQNTNLLIWGAMMQATYTVAGFAVNQGDAMDFALGTVTTASAAFTNAGEDNLFEKVDGTGASTSGAALAHSFDMSAPALTFLDAHATANDIWLNASSAVTSGTGVITFTGGFVRVFALDLGEPA